jgi:hypothetical protein
MSDDLIRVQIILDQLHLRHDISRMYVHVLSYSNFERWGAFTLCLHASSSRFRCYLSQCAMQVIAALPVHLFCWALLLRGPMSVRIFWNAISLTCTILVHRFGKWCTPYATKTILCEFHMIVCRCLAGCFLFALRSFVDKNNSTCNGHECKDIYLVLMLCLHESEFAVRVFRGILFSWSRTTQLRLCFHTVLLCLNIESRILESEIMGRDIWIWHLRIAKIGHLLCGCPLERQADGTEQMY